MAVVESTGEIVPREITPKSILRHRPIGDKPLTGKRMAVTTAVTPARPRSSRPRFAKIDEVISEWRYANEGEQPTTPLPQEIEQDHQQPVQEQKPPQQRKIKRVVAFSPVGEDEKVQISAHPLLYLGMGMLVMLILWAMLSVVTGWLSIKVDDLRYGRPRTFQTDAWVGHNEQNGVPSHFIVSNLNRRIDIIEIPGGDAAHARIYLGPQLYGEGDDLAPVTLSFVDINGDHKPDMLVKFQGSRVALINDGTGFRPLLPGERPLVERFLQRLGQ